MNIVQTIHLDDYVQTGEGGTAQAYTHKDGRTLAKLYNPGFEADRAREEFLTARTVFEMGLPTPEPLRLVTDGVRNGAEYELIKDKRSFTRIISQEPGRLEEMSLTFARLAKELHAKQADTARLGSMKERVRRFYMEKDMVPEAYKRKALQFIEQVPEATTCLHGDLQIGNIITDGHRTLWIDVGEFGYGIPEWDLGMMWTITHRMDDRRSDFLFHVTHETLLAHWNIFFPAYLGTTDPQRIAEEEHRLEAFASAKIPFMVDMAHHTRLPEEAFQQLVTAFENHG